MKLYVPYSIDTDDLIFALQIAKSCDHDLSVSKQNILRACEILDDISYKLDIAGDCITESFPAYRCLNDNSSDVEK